ncbi:MAG: hypothetical protein J2P21_27870, partial [Chloracidobacterium sp.]|nr:hypothetical protein [Chloracidobacterium sp.]
PDRDSDHLLNHIDRSIVGLAGDVQDGPSSQRISMAGGIVMSSSMKSVDPSSGALSGKQRKLLISVREKSRRTSLPVMAPVPFDTADANSSALKFMPSKVGFDHYPLRLSCGEAVLCLSLNRWSGGRRE